MAQKGNNQGLKVDRVPGNTDFLMKVDEDNCPRYAILRKFATNSSEYASIQKYFSKNFQSNFEKATSLKINSVSQLQKMCGYIEWAKYQELELKF